VIDTRRAGEYKETHPFLNPLGSEDL